MMTMAKLVTEWQAVSAKAGWQDARQQVIALLAIIHTLQDEPWKLDCVDLLGIAENLANLDRTGSLNT